MRRHVNGLPSSVLEVAKQRPAMGWFNAKAWSRTAVLALLTLGLAYLILTPLFRLQELALSDNGRAYRTMADSPGLRDTLLSTATLAVGSLVIALVFGTMLAWFAHQLPPRLQWVSVIPVLPIVIPAVASVTGWAFLLSPRVGYLNAVLRSILPFGSGREGGPFDVYTIPWIVVITGLGLTSFIYLFVRTGLRNINVELSEAAEVSGSTSFGVFFRVVLPLLRPSLIFGAGIALLLGMGQFTAPLLLGRTEGINVLTTEMYIRTQAFPVDYGLAAAFGSPLVVIGIAVVWGQKIGLGDQRRFVTHGGKAFKATSRVRWWPVIPLGIYGVVAIAMPLGALVIVSVSPFWSGEIDVTAFTLENFRTVLFDDTRAGTAIRNSVFYSVAGVGLVIPLGFVAASVIVHQRGRRLYAGILDFLVSLPLGIPAVIFGAGFLFAYTKPPFVLYGTATVVVLVYVTLMIPFSTRLQMSGLIAIGTDYNAAARASGAGALRTALTVTLPLVRPAIAAASALMFVLLTHEFSASLLVRSPRTQVMGTLLFDLWSFGSYPQVAVMALVMCGVTSAGVALAMLLGGRDVVDRL